MLDLARHWQRDMPQRPSVAEIEAWLLQAFWRGELEVTLPGVAEARDIDPRVRVLNGCRHAPQDAGLIVVDRPEDLPPDDPVVQPDGSVLVDLRRRVIWPTDPAQQTPELLAAACTVLAVAKWDDYHDLTKPVLAMFEVGRDAFGAFCSEAGFALPPFWFRPDTRPATVQARSAVRPWLRAKVAAGDKQYGKADYWREAKAAFPRLSVRAFNDAWAEETPSTWREPGTLKASKSSR
ncbi:hypothetical protein [Dankookia sp. GCM10030260]|uniref:hypothetical protein n=1 Tax=Dankookia sp. GCM10030260 TaxID=3273390 RepID=UPI0036D2149E